MSQKSLSFCSFACADEESPNTSRSDLFRVIKGKKYCFIYNVSFSQYRKGHALWYNLIPGTEVQKKEAVVFSLSGDRRTRQKLEEKRLPSLHLEYAALVGAYSGQFLLEEYENERMNDLEEHFARNLDYLIKGKPIVLLPESKASVDDVLAFYKKYRVIDDQFEAFYRKSIDADYEGKGVQKIPINEMIDGDQISTALLKRISDLKRNS